MGGATYIIEYLSLLDLVKEKELDLQHTKELLNKLQEIQLDIKALNSFIELIKSYIDIYYVNIDMIYINIDSLTNSTSKELLKLRYIEGLSWIEVEEAMSYSHAQIHRLHIRALAEYRAIEKL